MDRETINFDDKDFGITPIGTYSGERKTWLWAWANDSFPGGARERSRTIQALYDLTGFNVFLNPGIAGTQTNAMDLTAMAVHQLDAIGYFQAPMAPAILYLAIHEV